MSIPCSTNCNPLCRQSALSKSNPCLFAAWEQVPAPVGAIIQPAVAMPSPLCLFSHQRQVLTRSPSFTSQSLALPAFMDWHWLLFTSLGSQFSFAFHLSGLPHHHMDVPCIATVSFPLSFPGKDVFPFLLFHLRGWVPDWLLSSLGGQWGLPLVHYSV